MGGSCVGCVGCVGIRSLTPREWQWQYGIWLGGTAWALGLKVRESFGPSARPLVLDLV